jgi:Domain of unknown function (DUF4431)
MQMKCRICLLSLILVTAASTQAQRRQLHYEPDKVTLTGRIVYRTFHGPPNYGENRKTDSRETQPILILDSAVDVVATENDPMNKTERGVTSITLVVEHPIRTLRGKSVVTEGILFHAHTGHHHTKVLMTVSSIKKVNRG